MNKALLVIDVQKDYFPGGRFPLWHANEILEKVESAITTARYSDIPVIFVQHRAPGETPFLQDGTEGVELHGRIVAAAPNAPVVVKQFADSFINTRLDALLDDLKVDELLICGMMTQNCVTHTALSRAADKYRVVVLSDGCTTVNEVVHGIALQGLTPRVQIKTVGEVM